MNATPQPQCFINSYGVLITIVEGATRKVYARAVYGSKSMDDVELRSDISEQKLRELSINKVYMIANEGLRY